MVGGGTLCRSSGALSPISVDGETSCGCSASLALTAERGASGSGDAVESSGDLPELPARMGSVIMPPIPGSGTAPKIGCAITTPPTVGPGVAPLPSNPMEIAGGVPMMTGIGKMGIPCTTPGGVSAISLWCVSPLCLPGCSGSVVSALGGIILVGAVAGGIFLVAGNSAGLPVATSAGWALPSMASNARKGDVGCPSVVLGLLVASFGATSGTGGAVAEVMLFVMAELLPCEFDPALLQMGPG